MEADRLNRERTTVLVSAKAQTKTIQIQCDEIDEHIKLIDARARMPHSSPEGDWLNTERKKLFDQRFSLGC